MNLALKKQMLSSQMLDVAAHLNTPEDRLLLARSRTKKTSPRHTIRKRQVPQRKPVGHPNLVLINALLAEPPTIRPVKVRP
ncbi:hypothetical protein EC973_000091 [Apophysomyces ossiformis]|uniref:Uncharacterized protein n=1 Tax=Apophysomyces ossiformis TaxID=679940 RepID=A0A8H7BWL7_9FUNG|nr:hypothetical protein EC973_000091 [Apophysomyces ossiformis]